jgi:hypothetical protein
MEVVDHIGNIELLKLPKTAFLCSAMARGLKQRIEPELKIELDKSRLLIVSPFKNETKRITTETAMKRNQLMIELADNITVVS